MMLLSLSLIIVMGIVEAFNLSSLINDKVEQRRQEFLNVTQGAENAVSRALINFIYISCAAVAVLLSVMSYKLVIGVEKVEIEWKSVN